MHSDFLARIHQPVSCHLITPEPQPSYSPSCAKRSLLPAKAPAFRRQNSTVSIPEKLQRQLICRRWPTLSPVRGAWMKSTGCLVCRCYPNEARTTNLVETFHQAIRVAVVKVVQVVLEVPLLRPARNTSAVFERRSNIDRRSYA